MTNLLLPPPPPVPDPRSSRLKSPLCISERRRPAVHRPRHCPSPSLSPVRPPHAPRAARLPRIAAGPVLASLPPSLALVPTPASGSKPTLSASPFIAGRVFARPYRPP
ncbi:hypothetical protein NL676_035104 [Syzygium grande]|nr:hypothetical protein NL676_035104 [Syzygium grande]